MSDNASRLSTLLHELFSDGSTVDAILLIDESGSVKGQLFDVQKSCARNLVLTLPFDQSKSWRDTPVRLSVMTYQHDTKKILEFESSPGDICCSIARLICRGGGTDLGLALKAAKNQFDTRTGARRVIFVFTDDDISSAVEQANDLIANHKVQIFVFCATALSENSQRQVANVASPRSAFFFPKGFSQVLDMFNCMKGATSTSAPTLGIVDRDPDSVVLTIEHAAPEEVFEHFEVELFNSVGEHHSKISTSSAAMPHNRTLRISGLPAGEKFEARIRGFLRQERTWTPWSSSRLTITMMHKAPELQLFSSPSNLEEATKQLAAKLAGYRVPQSLAAAGVKRLNMLLLGKVGKGKTSFLVTCATALNGSFTPLDVIAAQLTSVTQEYTSHVGIGVEGCEIDLRDIFGEEDKNYDAILQWIVGGQVPPGVKRGVTHEEISKMINTQATIADKVHAVLLVFSANSIQAPLEIETIKKIYSMLIKEGLQPLVLLTKIDEVHGSKLTVKTDLIWADCITDAAIATFCAKTEIQRNYVFPIVNYTGMPARRDYALEKLCLNALDAARAFAESRIRSYLSRNPTPKPTANCSASPSRSNSIPSSPGSAPESPVLQTAPSSPVCSPQQRLSGLPTQPSSPAPCSMLRVLIRLDGEEDNLLVELTQPVTLDHILDVFAEELELNRSDLGSVRVLTERGQLSSIRSDRQAARLRNDDVLICTLRSSEHK